MAMQLITNTNGDALKRGDRVYDVADERHIGRINIIIQCAANITWEETGWRSLGVPIGDLRKLPKLFIWGRTRALPLNLDRWGTVCQLVLNSEKMASHDLEILAERYSKAFPTQEFVVGDAAPIAAKRAG